MGITDAIVGKEAHTGDKVVGDARRSSEDPSSSIEYGT
jgi:hypothetical protein